MIDEKKVGLIHVKLGRFIGRQKNTNTLMCVYNSKSEVNFVQNDKKKLGYNKTVICIVYT